MSKTDASVAFSVTDNFSQSIVGMKNSVSTFKADITQLQSTLDKLDQTKFQLKNFDLKNAQKELERTKKAFEALADSATDADREAAKADFEQATQNYENVRRQLDLVSKQARQTEKDMLDATSAISKADNRAARSGSSSVLSALGAAGLGQMAGSAAQEIANTLIGSAFGGSTGSVISSSLSGSISGAAMGSLAGPIGAAIGGVLGGVIGLVQGETQAFQEKDEYFKSYYQGLYEDVTSARDESISSGSSIAAGRETDLISFSTLLGDKKTAESFLSNLVEMSNSTPFLYDDLTAMSKTLSTYGFKDKLGDGESGFEILDALQKVGDAGAALGMETSDMTSVSTALGRMLSSDKASLEYLNILNERGINAISMLAEARGKSVADTYEDISKGSISGSEAIGIILAGMEDKFAGSMELQSKTFAGLSSTLEGLQQEVENAGGEGYNDTRKEGIQAQIDALGGDLGDALGELNRISGENQAYLENLSDQYQREALSALLLGDETTLFGSEQQAELKEMREDFLQASAEYAAGNEEAGLKMESLKREAESLATAAYESSDAYQLGHNTELELIGAIQENTAALRAWKNDYELDQAKSKGIGSTYEFSSVPAGTLSADDWYDDGGNLHTSSQNSANGWYDDGGNWHPNAWGLERVPYDNYPALLHADERVLTAREAREADSGKGSIVIHIGGNWSVRSQDDADLIAETILNKLLLARQGGVH